MVKDVLRSIPDDALVLVSGDVYSNAADAACAVNHACERFDVVAPVWLHLPWARRQLARRHPEITLPEGAWSLTRIHELIDGQIPQRAVFVVPGLLIYDRSILKRFSLVPHGMLLRVYRTEEQAKADRDQQVAMLGRVADGSACTGCVLDPHTAFRPSQHLEVLIAYSVTMENAARFASRVGAREEHQLLSERVHRFDQAVGVDMISVGRRGE